jgi:hypothetical protein
MSENDAVVNEGVKPLLPIDVIESPEDECRDTSTRYVVLGRTVKLDVVLADDPDVVVVTLAVEDTVQAMVEVMPVPQVLLVGLLPGSPL